MCLLPKLGHKKSLRVWFKHAYSFIVSLLNEQSIIIILRTIVWNQENAKQNGVVIKFAPLWKLLMARERCKAVGNKE